MRTQAHYLEACMPLMPMVHGAAEFFVTYKLLGEAKTNEQVRRVLSEALAKLLDVQEEREKMFKMFIPCTFDTDTGLPSDYPSKDFIGTVLSFLKVDGKEFFNQIIPMFSDKNTEHFDTVGTSQPTTTLKTNTPPGLAKVST